jgi:hypothetical protein
MVGPLQTCRPSRTTVNEKKVSTVMINTLTNINKTKESFNSNGQQFNQ